MRIQLVESKHHIQVKENLNDISELVKSSTDNIDIFIYPECSLTGYDLSSNVEKLTDDDESFKTLEEICRDTQSGIFLGGVYEDCGNIYNGYFGILPHKQSYYKTHLGKREETFFMPGDTLPIFEYMGWKMGVVICVESHIPDLIQHYRLMGCQLIIMPFASPGVCGNRIKLWEKYLPTRAYDNGVYVAAVNLKDDYFSGGVMVINPKGEQVKAVEGSSIFDLDLSLVKKVQNKNYKCNYIKRRRPELY